MPRTAPSRNARTSPEGRLSPSPASRCSAPTSGSPIPRASRTSQRTPDMRATHKPADALDLFSDLPDWWIPGGWALDLWLGRTTRDHADLDIATLRRSQRMFWDRLADWDL